MNNLWKVIMAIFGSISLFFQTFLNPIMEVKRTAVPRNPMASSGGGFFGRGGGGGGDSGGGGGGGGGDGGSGGNAPRRRFGANVQGLRPCTTSS